MNAQNPRQTGGVTCNGYRTWPLDAIEGHCVTSGTRTLRLPVPSRPVRSAFRVAGYPETASINNAYTINQRPDVVRRMGSRPGEDTDHGCGTGRASGRKIYLPCGRYFRMAKKPEHLFWFTYRHPDGAGVVVASWLRWPVPIAVLNSCPSPPRVLVAEVRFSGTPCRCRGGPPPPADALDG